jgi:hypothetical protein
MGNGELGIVSRVGWEGFSLGIKIKCKVFEFISHESLHFFGFKLPKILYL